MSTIVESVRAEYIRYKALGEGAIAQIPDAQLGDAAGASGNSVATIVGHLSGNFASRFTDFLTTDGEKPWRNREEEFTRRVVSRDELLQQWEKGWQVLLGALDQLSDADLTRSITIRRQSHLVHEALHRSLAHAAYHVGQIVLLARAFRGQDWKFLSIPPGGSDAYNQTPRNERGEAHAAAIRKG